MTPGENKDVLITVDIFCNWEADPQAYRIYIDGELLTERTYCWRNPEQYVQENIVIFADAGEHYFKLEPVNKYFAGFYFKNFAVNKQPHSINNGAFVIN